MAHTHAERSGFLQQPSTAVLGVLVGLHVLVLVVILARAGSLSPGDADVARANRIATSPAIPYRRAGADCAPFRHPWHRFR